MEMMNAIAFVFARGGSKGLPGKNTMNLAGKPLIAWTIEHARSVGRIRRVLVSTDCPEIASIARDCGAEVPFMRPAELASDTSPEWLSWQHALKFISGEEEGMPDAMVTLPVTAPLRLPIDVERCLDVYCQGGCDVVVTVSESKRNPYFNMVTLDHYGGVHLANQSSTAINRRQDAPKMYDLSTVAYVANPSFILKARSIFEGRVKAVQVPPERAVDIDASIDFAFANFLMSSRIPHANT